MSNFNPSNDADLLLATNDDVIRALENAGIEALRRKRAPDEWSAGEIVGHMIELEPYWARAAASLAGQPGATIGRSSDSPIRLAGPASGDGLTPSDAVNRLTAAGNEAADILRGLSAMSAPIVGQQQDGSSVTVATIVDEFLLAHAREHADAVLAALDQNG